MNFCQKAQEMLMDLKRSDFLPAYDEDGVRLVLSEIKLAHTKVEEIMESNISDGYDGNQETMLYYSSIVTRNRLCLNSYLTHRMEKIRSLPWSTGPVLPERIINNNILSAREMDYFSKYNAIITNYCEDVDLDLFSELEPPKELKIVVRVLVPSGDIMTDNGPVNLSSVGDTLFLRRSDVEQLIRHGQLEHVQQGGANV